MTPEMKLAALCALLPYRIDAMGTDAACPNGMSGKLCHSVMCDVNGLYLYKTEHVFVIWAGAGNDANETPFTTKSFRLEEIKPILRPFSRLTHEIKIENEITAQLCGKKVGDVIVPAVEAARLGLLREPKDKMAITDKNTLRIAVDWDKEWRFAIDTYFGMRAYTVRGGNEIVVCNHIKIHTFLRSLHFNVDSFPEGEFIEKSNS